MIEKKIEECKYCSCAREHARKHGKDEIHVLCKIHRALLWYANNAYHEGNVEWRNPMSANSYKLDLINIDPPKLPKFSFSIIAKMDAMTIAYNDEAITVYPAVIADIKKGEYTNRRFAIIFCVFGEQMKWGVLENNIMKFIHYAGLHNMRGIIDTCTFGNASSEIKTDDITYYAQRNECDECGGERLK